MNKVFLTALSISALVHVPLVCGVSLPGFPALHQGTVDSREMTVYYQTSVIDRDVVHVTAPVGGVQTETKDQISRQPVCTEQRDVKIMVQEKKQRRTKKGAALKKEFVPTVEKIDLRDVQVRTIFFSYYDDVRASIKQHTLYPDRARQERKEGQAYISFVLRRDGAISEIVLLDSTGDERLDDAAMSSIRNAAPFAPFPGVLKVPEVKLNVPISFELE